MQKPLPSKISGAGLSFQTTIDWAVKSIYHSNLVVFVVCHLVTSAVAPVLSVVLVVPVVFKISGAGLSFQTTTDGAVNSIYHSNLVVFVVCHLVTSHVASVLSVVLVVPVVVKNSRVVVKKSHAKEIIRTFDCYHTNF